MQKASELGWQDPYLCHNYTVKCYVEDIELNREVGAE